MFMLACPISFESKNGGLCLKMAVNFVKSSCKSFEKPFKVKLKVWTLITHWLCDPVWWCADTLSFSQQILDLTVCIFMCFQKSFPVYS